MFLVHLLKKTRTLFVQFKMLQAIGLGGFHEQKYLTACPQAELQHQMLTDIWHRKFNLWFMWMCKDKQAIPTEIMRLVCLVSTIHVFHT